MSVLCILLLIGVPRVFGQTNQNIKHGDSVKLFVNQLMSMQIREDGKIYLGKGNRSSTFKIYKYPYYTSRNDILLSGQGIRFVDSNGNVCNLVSKVFNCIKKDVNNPIIYRLLDKHGSDKIEMYNRQLVKIREKGNSIDCSLTDKRPLSCYLRTNKPEEYGFVIIKI